MKKNISINISGIIFHVEEDGYELLKNYLESISRYFSTYEDNQEITDDIESRIAEIFLSKLSHSKQVITREDVDSVMVTMGSVEDFAAAEGEIAEEEPAYHQSQQERTYQEKTFQEEEKTGFEGRKKLFRDTRRRVIGGVAAGIAQYFNADPIWIRLLFIALFFADIFASMGTIMLIVYVVLWIVVPGTDGLPEDEKIKKLYRNPDDKVLGGVCGGIAAYFGADATIIRLLFVLSVIFFGTGVLAYIVLWIITPQANTLTEKMQMKGEPVTLSNIESSIKKNFNVNEEGEETTLVKVLLFPFRLIAVVLNNLGKVLGPLLVFIGEAARVILGLLLFLVGIAFVFVLLAVGGVLMGIYSAEPADIFTNLPIQVIQSSIPDWGIAFAYLFLLIPSVALLLAGIAVVAKRRIVNAPVAWTALGVWFVCLAALSVTLVPFIMDFQDEARYTTTENYELNGSTAVLTLQEYPDEEFIHPVLYLRGHDSSFFALKKEFEANGRNRQQAIQNAQMIEYHIEVQDSVISFPANFTFKEEAKYRFQELDLVLYIPYEHPFMMDHDLSYILRNTLSQSGYSDADMQDNIFVFTRSGLECLTCEQRKNMDDEFGQTIIPHVSGDYSKTFDIKNFDAVEMSGPFRVNITQGETFEVKVQGQENIVAQVEARVDGTTLVLDYDPGIFQGYNGMIGVSVAMPQLSEVVLGGATQANIDNFTTTDLHVDISGSSRAFVQVNGEAVTTHMAGASNLKLFGKTATLEAEIKGASRLDALALETGMARIEADGAARAKVNVQQELHADIEGAANVEYQGNPTINVNEEGQRKMEKIE